MSTQKKFDAWNAIKKSVEMKDVTVFWHTREIWWCSLGVNVGSEEDGKNELFERPVLILKVFNKNMVRIVPLTSKIVDDNNHVLISYGEYTSSVKLSQLKTISTKRLTRKLGQLDVEQFQKVGIILQKNLL